MRRNQPNKRSTYYWYRINFHCLSNQQLRIAKFFKGFFRAFVKFVITIFRVKIEQLWRKTANFQK